MCVCAHSVMSGSVNPWTIACPPPLSMKFSKQENESGLPFPTPGDLPNPGIKPVSPVSPALAGRFFTGRPPELMLSNHLILCLPFFFCLQSFPASGFFPVDAFELWCWRRFLRVRTARRSN